MSGSSKTLSSAAAASALAPVFVVQFGSGRCNNNSRRKKKRQDDDNREWHVCDSLCLVPSALSSSFSSFLLIFLVILCSIGGLKGSEISPSSSTTALSNNFNSNGVPTFDLNDLKNLIEIFPEFREYVYKVVTSHVEKQKQQQQRQYRNNEHAATTTAKPVIASPFSSPSVPTSGYNFYDGGTSPNSRKDLFSVLPQKSNNHAPGQKTPAAMSKHGYGWSHYDDYHSHDHDHHSHHDSHHGYGYEPAKPSHFGWGWNNDAHHETHKDPKFHYQVGYQLGKDLSCFLGLLGFKSVKDFSIYSFFSFLKKLKYIALIGLAFKLGMLLSPIALPMLFPVILLALIAKLLPLCLIILLLFKLLKTQLKFGIGKRTGEISGDIVSSAGTVSSLLEGTNISRLWKSIEDATHSVTENEECVEKIICKMVQQRSVNSTTFNEDDDLTETGRSSRSVLSGLHGIVRRLLLNMTDWLFPKRKWKFTENDKSEDIWECDKIQCT